MSFYLLCPEAYYLVLTLECHHFSGITIYKCTSLKSGKYTMQCDSDVSRVMFLRFYEAVEIDIYRKLTPRLHNIKVQLGECPAINSDMHVNVEVDVESCQVHFHLSYLYQIVDKYKVHVSHPILKWISIKESLFPAKCFS